MDHTREVTAIDKFDHSNILLQVETKITTFILALLVKVHTSIAM